MLWAVLAVAVSATPNSGAAPFKVASTYDEAACAEAQAEKIPSADEEINCSEAPAVPAVLDCNSQWLGEMIGSCDMPEAPGAALRAGNNNSNNSNDRLCRDGRCGIDASMPIHSAGRFSDDLTPILPKLIAAPDNLGATPLDRTDDAIIPRVDGERLERPPRR